MMKAQLEETIQEKVRPILSSHGGDVELVSALEGVCKVKLKGKCSHCPAASITMEEIIKKELLAEHPEIRDVVLINEISQDMLNFARELLQKR